MAYVLEEWKLYNEAINIYEQLISDNPQHVELYSDLAWAHYQSGGRQRAVEILYGAICLNSTHQEQYGFHIKAMLLEEMNAIISMHKDQLDLSAIPASLIRALPVDMRIVISCNKGNISNISISEPGGSRCTYSAPVTKNGGTIQHGYYWYYGHPFEYKIKNAPAGKYKISVNYYDYYSYYGKIPSFVRIKQFRNFGKPNQSVGIRNVIMDNQNGEVEIDDFILDEKNYERNH
jgi:tetratricopeptide (TPR) repeat protein